MEDPLHIICGVILDLYLTLVSGLCFHGSLRSQNILQIFFDLAVYGGKILAGICGVFLLLPFTVHGLQNLLDKDLCLPDRHLPVENGHGRFILYIGIGDLDQAPGMSGGEHIFNHHLLDLLAKLKQPEGVGNGGPSLGYPVGHLILLQMEFLDERFSR